MWLVHAVMQSRAAYCINAMNVCVTNARQTRIQSRLSDIRSRWVLFWVDEPIGVVILQWWSGRGQGDAKEQAWGYQLLHTSCHCKYSMSGHDLIGTWNCSFSSDHMQCGGVKQMKSCVYWVLSQTWSKIQPSQRSQPSQGAISAENNGH